MIKKDVANKERMEYLGLVCESYQELYFLFFVEELMQRGYIDKIERAESIILTHGLKHTYTKQNKSGSSGKVVEQTLLQPSLYTPEFIITWNKDKYSDFVWILGVDSNKYEKPFVGQQLDRDNLNNQATWMALTSLIEVKADFDMGNMTRLFKNNQKFVYDKHKLFINLIKVPSFFEKTFTPAKFLLTTKTGKSRKINYMTTGIDEYLSRIV